MTTSRTEEYVSAVTVGTVTIEIVYRITAVAGVGGAHATWGWVDARPVRVVVSGETPGTPHTIAVAE
jgi:hypothetical protein